MGKYNLHRNNRETTEYEQPRYTSQERMGKLNKLKELHLGRKLEFIEKRRRLPVKGDKNDLQ